MTKAPAIDGIELAGEFRRGLQRELTRRRPARKRVYRPCTHAWTDLVRHVCEQGKIGEHVHRCACGAATTDGPVTEPVLEPRCPDCGDDLVADPMGWTCPTCGSEFPDD